MRIVVLKYSTYVGNDLSLILIVKNFHLILHLDYWISVLIGSLQTSYQRITLLFALKKIKLNAMSSTFEFQSFRREANVLSKNIAKT